MTQKHKTQRRETKSYRDITPYFSFDCIYSGRQAYTQLRALGPLKLLTLMLSTGHMFASKSSYPIWEFGFQLERER